MATLHVEYKLRGDSTVMAAMDAKVETLVGVSADETGVWSKPEFDEQGAYNLREMDFPGMDDPRAVDLVVPLRNLLGTDCVLVIAEEEE